MSYAWRQRINKAINDDDIVIFIQPIVDMATREVKGFEALSRFPLQNGEYWAPDIWFKEAHIAGLGVDLEIAAMRAAVCKIPLIDKKYYVGLNVSAMTILEEPYVISLLSEFPNRIVIEITEHDAIEHYSPLIERLDIIRKQHTKTQISVDGILVAVDDAGSGFASLRHIIRLHPDIIKIDGYLIRELYLEENKPKQAAVKALCSLAQDLDIEVVAEGVESQREVDTLVGMGVEFGQGYFFGKPALL